MQDVSAIIIVLYESSELDAATLLGYVFLRWGMLLTYSRRFVVVALVLLRMIVCFHAVHKLWKSVALYCSSVGRDEEAIENEERLS